MTLEARVAKLEKLVHKLADALLREDTEQDGNWGWPSFQEELIEIKRELDDQLSLPLKTKNNDQTVNQH